MSTQRPIQLKRVYDPPAAGDGLRVLVDRLWPRGLTRAQAAADLWLKDAAPSSALRRWYGHDPRRWSEFQRKYRGELTQQDAALDRLRELRGRGPLTLLYAARDTAHTHALVLRDVLQQGGAAARASGGRKAKHGSDRQPRE